MQKIVVTLLIFTLPLLVNGCTSAAFRTEANSFTAAYGDVLNEQMLLNLARLDNGDPAYFLAIGTLNSRWNMGITGGQTLARNGSNSTTKGETEQANSAGVLGLASRTLSTVSSFVTGRSSVLGVESRVQPDFQLIPLNNELLAQQVLQQTRTDVFFGLYEQGFPIDLLMRVLVEEIDATEDGSSWVLRNNPIGTSSASFARFLFVCQIARDLQKSGALKVDKTESTFVPLGGDAITEPPNPEIVMKTKQDGAFWKETSPGRWQLGRNQSQLRFKIVQNVSAFDGPVETPNEDKTQLSALYEPQREFGSIVRNWLSGAAVEGKKIENPAGVEKGTSDQERKVRLVLRSYSRILEAVATEQNTFPSQNRSGLEFIPAPQNGPVIRTRWDGIPVGHAIGAVRYAGRQYYVADPKNPGERSRTWNRDVFRLLVALNSQVAVDISKFQRQVLEVR